MTQQATITAADRVIGRLRVAGWTLAALALLLPLVAMQFTPEVQWTVTDFAVFGGMLAIAGGLMELAARTRSLPYLFAAAVAVGTGFFMVWASLAVGINGDGSTDLIYAGVLAVALLGAVIARFRAGGMAAAMFVTALAALAAGAVSYAAVWIPADQTLRVLGMTGMVVAAFVVSALLFRRAASEKSAT